MKWGKRVGKTLKEFEGEFDMISICTQDALHEVHLADAFTDAGPEIRGVWMEKPFGLGNWRPMVPIQVNYLRRADHLHREIHVNGGNNKLIVYGKDDETTRCHFSDLARFWKCELDYRPFDGPCAYVLESTRGERWFDNGGINPGDCMKGMLKNLLDAMDNGTELFSPPYVE